MVVVVVVVVKKFFYIILTSACDGASAGGIARPVLQAFENGGRAGAVAFLERVENELRMAMLLTGSRDLAALRTAPRTIAEPLRGWLSPAAAPSAG